MNGGNNSQVGVGKSFKVYPGDKVKIQAYAKYFDPQSTSSNLGAFAGALLNAFALAPPAGGEIGTPSAGVNQGGNILAGGSGKTPNGFPAGYVNILILDKNYNFLDIAYQQMDGGEQAGVSPKYEHDFMEREYTASEEGYVYLFVSNESPTLVDIYFDDVVITHTRSNVIQYNEYYPFGLRTASSWTRENVTGNNFLGNGGTELNPTSSLYDLAYRNYDPILGRMNGVDPRASKYASLSPYNFSFNDPVTFTDPSGADPWDEGPYGGGMAVYYAMNGESAGGRETIMDPIGWGGSYNSVTAGGYGQAGCTGGYSLSGTISSYSPDYGGPERVQYWDGSYGNVLPSQRAWAENQGGQSIASYGSVDISGFGNSAYNGSAIHNKYEFIWKNGKPKYIGKGNAKDYPFYTHELIIRMAFGRNLSEKQIRWMIEGSEYADDPDNGYQDPAYAYMHSMRSSSNQSIQEAESLRRKYTNEKLDDFARFSMNPSNSAHMEYAFFSLGMGMHPLMDQFSVSHRGWQVWDPSTFGGFMSAVWHFRELFSEKGVLDAVKSIQVYYNKGIMLRGSMRNP